MHNRSLYLLTIDLVLKKQSIEDYSSPKAFQLCFHWFRLCRVGINENGASADTGKVELIVLHRVVSRKYRIVFVPQIE